VGSAPRNVFGRLFAMFISMVLLAATSYDVKEVTVADFKKLATELAELKTYAVNVTLDDYDPKMCCNGLTLVSTTFEDSEKNVLEFIDKVALFEDDAAVVNYAHDLLFEVEVLATESIGCGDCNGGNGLDVLSVLHSNCNS